MTAETPTNASTSKGIEKSCADDEDGTKMDDKEDHEASESGTAIGMEDLTRILREAEKQQLYQKAEKVVTSHVEAKGLGVDEDVTESSAAIGMEDLSRMLREAKKQQEHRQEQRNSASNKPPESPMVEEEESVAKAGEPLSVKAEKQDAETQRVRLAFLQKGQKQQVGGSPVEGKSMQSKLATGLSFVAPATGTQPATPATSSSSSSFAQAASPSHNTLLEDPTMTSLGRDYGPGLLSRPGALAIPGLRSTELAELDLEAPSGTGVQSTAAGTSQADEEGEMNNLAQAQAVEEGGILTTANEVDILELERRKSDNKQKTLSSVIVLLVLVIILLIVSLAVVLGIILPDSKAENDKNLQPPPAGNGSTSPYTTDPPTQVLTLAPTAFVLDFPHDTQQAIMIPGSPQSRAYAWLLEDPNFDVYPEWRKVQRFSLATLYFATDGKNWDFGGQGSHWLDYNTHECDWESKGGYYYQNIYDAGAAEEVFINLALQRGILGYVTYGWADFHNRFAPPEGDPSLKPCGDGDTYLHLWLSGIQGFSGFIPPEISLLSALENLEINQNKELAGSIPSQIGRLTNMKWLTFWDDGLSGPLPTQIGQLTNLLHLSLVESGGLTGPIPSELGELHKTLISFIVQGNEFTSLPSQIGRLTKLIQLGLNENPINSDIPSELGLMSGLRILKMGDFLNSEDNLPFDLELVEITKVGAELGQIPSEIGQLTGLKLVNLGHADLTGSIPSEMGRLSELVYIALNSNSLTGTIPRELGNMQSLEFLNLLDNQLSGILASEVAAISSLRLIDVRHSPLTGTIPMEYTNLVNLSSIYISNTNLSGLVPPDMCAAADLKFDCSGILCGCACNCSTI